LGHDHKEKLCLLHLDEQTGVSGDIYSAAAIATVVQKTWTG
jgi:hypothetical protein